MTRTAFVIRLDPSKPMPRAYEVWAVTVGDSRLFQPQLRLTPEPLAAHEALRVADDLSRALERHDG
jgi:hypothetical protein